MAMNYMVLGQVNPAATTETPIYTVPTGTTAIASSIIICNTSATQGSFRVAISVSGASTTTKDYIYYDLLIGGNDTFIATIGVTLSAGDVVKAYSSNSSMAFSLYGSQIV